MKFLIFMFFCLPNILWACPNISGDFLCEDNGASTLVRMRQNEKNGSTYYYDVEFPEQGILADNKVILVPDQGPRRNSTYRAYCEKTAFKGTLRGDLYYGKDYMGSFVETTRMALTVQLDLEISESTELYMPEEPVEKTFDSKTCKRQNPVIKI
ncbi:MAG: hypothetical protein HOO06_11570 [Bdellovibrionaceae bacterium]|nr:hypothetical protein [Pseudobdellovibrionaceae bacterium]